MRYKEHTHCQTRLLTQHKQHKHNTRIIDLKDFSQHKLRYKIVKLSNIKKMEFHINHIGHSKNIF